MLIKIENQFIFWQIRQRRMEQLVEWANMLKQQQQRGQEQQIGEMMALISAQVHDSGSKISERGLFLLKVHKTNLSSKVRKLNDIRLSHLNSFLERNIEALPKDQKSVELLFQIVIGFLQSEKNFSNDQESFQMHNILVTISRLMESCILPIKEGHSKLIDYLLVILQYLTSGLLKDFRLMDSAQFSQKLENSVYATSQIDKTSHSDSFEVTNTEDYSLLAPISKEIVLRSISASKFYHELFYLVPKDKKMTVVDYFVQNLKTLGQQIKSKVSLFCDTFVKNLRDDPQEIEAIIYGAERQIFNLEQTTHIFQTLLIQIKSHKRLWLLSTIKVKAYRYEQTFIKIAMKECQTSTAQQLVQSLLYSKKMSNYLLLYLIVKSKKHIPKSYINLLFDNFDKTITNNVAIVIAIAIVSNPNSAFQILQKYDHNSGSPSVQFKTNVLKFVHFAFQNCNRAVLLNKILQNISAVEINKESDLNFLPFNSLQKIELQKQEIKTLKQFLRQQFDNSEKSFRIKIDINTLCGQQTAVLRSIKLSLSLLDRPTEQVLKSIHLTPQQILDAVLMGLNNKLEHHYIQDISQATVDWIIKSYNLYWNHLQSELKSVLRRKGIDKLTSLILSIMLYNQTKTANLSIDDGQLQPAIAAKPVKMKGIQISQYYLQFNKIGRELQKVVKLRVIVSQLRSLLGYLVSFEEKFGNKKDAKAILMAGGQDVFTLQIINYYLSNNVNQTHPGLNILEKVFFFKETSVKLEQNQPSQTSQAQKFQTFRPQIRFLEQLERKAQQISQDYFSIYQHIPKLLRILYPQTIAYVASLLQSPCTIQQQAPLKKSKGKKRRSEPQKNQTQPNQIIEVLLANMQCVYQNPNKLTSFENLMFITRKMISYVNMENNQSKGLIDQKTIAFQIAKWLQGIKIFHSENFSDWKTKVNNLTKLWRQIQSIFKKIKYLESIIALKELERHFLILVDLLNTLYQKFRNQAEILQIQQQILLTMCIIYGLSSNCKQQRLKSDFLQQQEEQLRQIPKSVIQNAFKGFKLRNVHFSPKSSSKETHYYFCHTCGKSICQICANFIHKIHDKTYSGFQGSCEHDRHPQQKKNKSKHDDADYLKQKIKTLQSMGMFPFGYRRDGGQELPYELFLKLQKQHLLQQIQGQDFEVRQLLRRELGGERNPKVRGHQQSKKAKKRQQQQQKEEEIQEDNLTIKSASQKSFQTYAFKSSDATSYKSSLEARQFLCEKQDYIAKKLPQPSINLAPLSNLLIRQLQGNLLHCAQLQNIEQKNRDFQKRKITHEIQQNRIQFMRTNSFKISARQNPYIGGRVQYQHSSATSLKDFHMRNILSSNKKYLALGVPASVFILNLTQIKRRFIKKQITKKTKGNLNLEPENQLKNATITNLGFDVNEVIFSQFNEQFVALVGNNHIAIYQVNGQGKTFKHLPQDFTTNQSILKFAWINQVKMMFAYAVGRQIRIVHVDGGNRVKKVAQVTAPATVKDFTISFQRKMFTLYALDIDDKLYREEFPAKSLFVNLTGRSLIFGQDLGSVSSILGLRNKLIIATTSKNIYNVEFPNFDSEKEASESYKQRIINLTNQQSVRVQKFDLGEQLKEMKLSTPSVGWLSYPVSLRFFSNGGDNDSSLILSCLLKRQNNFKTGINASQGLGQIHNRRVPGVTCFMEFKDNSSLNLHLLNPQFEIDAYEVSPLDQNSYLLLGFQQEGVLTTTRYSLPLSSSISNAQLGTSISSGAALLEFNQIIKENSYVNKLSFIDNARCANFKSPEVSKNVTPRFIIHKNQNNLNLQNVENAFTFICGISIHVKPIGINSLANMKFSFLGVDYIFQLKSQRIIHLGLTLKETLFLFTNNQPIYIEFKDPIQFVVDKVQVYGEEWTPSIFNNGMGIQHNLHQAMLNPFLAEQLKEGSANYHRDCIIKIKKLHQLYVNYPTHSAEHYFLNKYRIDLANVNITDVIKLLEAQGYSRKQANLLLKVQILAQSLPHSSIKNCPKRVREVVQLSKEALLAFCQHKHYLENSCYRLMRVLSGIYPQKSDLQSISVVHKIGHPFQVRTILDLFYLERYYNLWRKDKKISSYEDLLRCLQKVTTTRVYNLYLLMKLFPSLVLQICSFFAVVASQVKSYPSRKRQIWKVKMSQLCNILVTIVCQYYQLSKNCKSNQVGQQQNQIERRTLSLLEFIFCLIKKDFLKEMLLNPFENLEKLYIPNIKNSEAECGVNIFKVQSIQEGTRPIMLEVKNAMDEEDADQDDQMQLPREENEQQMFEQEKSWEQQEREMEMAPQHNNLMQQEQSHDQSRQHFQVQLKQAKLNLAHEPNKQDAITNCLLNAAIRPSAKVPFQNYQMAFELATSIFHEKNLITPSNAVFYMGFLFNLLRIIETRMHPIQDQSRMYALCQKIDSAILDKSKSALFMVLNTFIEADYYLTKDQTLKIKKSNSMDCTLSQQKKLKRQHLRMEKIQHSYNFYKKCRKVIQKDQFPQSHPTTICQQILNFYKGKQKKCNPLLKVRCLNVDGKQKIVKLNEALMFVSFDITNPAYTIKYLGNLYINLRRQGYFDFLQEPENSKMAIEIKSIILSTVVKTDFRIFRNIMIYEGWVNSLESARIDVGFQKLKFGDQGAQIIHQSANKHRQIFRQSMDQQRILTLQQMVTSSQGMTKINQTIIQILQMYYQTDSTN